MRPVFVFIFFIEVNLLLFLGPIFYCLKLDTPSPGLCSTGIETVIEKENGKEGGLAADPALCTVCEMAVIWFQNQLKQKGTKEKALSYINQVSYFEAITFVLCLKLQVFFFNYFF